MSQHLLKAPDTVSVTSTPQAVTLPETECWYSIRNGGTADVYFIAINTDGYTAATYTDATAATLRTAGCGMVKSGETLAFLTDHPHIYLVCTNGLTATANIEPGILGSAVNVEANVGNLGLLNGDETEIAYPAQGLKDDAAFTPGTSIVNPIGAEYDDTAPDSVDEGDIGAPRMSADRILYVRNVHHGQTLAFARIDDSAMTGGTYSGALVGAVGSKKIYVVELFLTVSAQCEIEWVEDPAGTPAILATAPPMYFAARGGIYMPRQPGYRFATNTVNKALGLDEVANGTVSVRGYLWYYTAA